MKKVVSLETDDEYGLALNNLLYFTNGFDRKTATKAPTPYPAWAALIGELEMPTQRFNTEPLTQISNNDCEEPCMKYKTIENQ